MGDGRVTGRIKIKYVPSIVPGTYNHSITISYAFIHYYFPKAYHLVKLSASLLWSSLSLKRKSTIVRWKLVFCVILVKNHHTRACMKS